MPQHPLFPLDLPAGWRLVSADDIRSPEAHSCVAGPFGSNISSKFFTQSGVPVIRGGNLRDDLTRFVPSGFAFVSHVQAQQYRAQHVRAGDLVFTCWGTIGQVGLIPADGPFSEYIISNKQLKLRPDPARADHLYLFYYFASPQMVGHIKGKAIGAAVPGINLGILKSLPVAFPPLPIQRRIAAILSAYDDLIENNRKRIAILEDMARRLYREWFVHFRYPGHESVPLVDSPLGRIPQGWEAVPASAMMAVLSGGTPKTEVSGYWGGNIPFFTPKDAHNESWVTDTEKHLTEEGLNACHSALFPRKTLFITARGTVGKLALAHLPMAMNQSCYALQPTNGVSPEYLFLTMTHAIARFKAVAIGGIFDTIVVDTFSRIHLVRPPADLTVQLTHKVEPMLSLVENLQVQNATLRRTRDLLLPRLMSGTLSVAAAEAAAS